MNHNENCPITGKTKLTGLLGSPVAHSLSPLMHNTSFQLLGLDYVYLCFEVTEETLSDAVKGLVACHVRGFNLTMPNKNKVLEYLDELSPAARLIGAVNTVVNEGGKLVGYNTDGIGFVRSLADEQIYVPGKTLTVLGAGGAASAIIAQLALDGAEAVNVVLRKTSRFYSRMEAMAARILEDTPCRIRLVPQEEMGDAIACSDILINGTSVGMAGQESGSLVTDLSLLRPDLCVADVIYNPRQTKLLLDAKQRGCKTCNGLHMLLYQGAEAFRLWTGREMPVEVVRERIWGEK